MATAGGKVIDQLLVKIGYRTDHDELRAAGDKFEGLKKKANALSWGLAKVGLAGAGAMADVLRDSIRFSAQLQRLKVRAQHFSDAQIQSLRGQALEVSSKIALDPTEVAEGMVLLRQLGHEYDAIRSLTPTVAKTAFVVKNEGITTDQVVGWANTIQQVWGLTNEDMSFELDKMFAAANTTAAGFEQLGNSLRFTAKSAQLAGMSTEALFSLLGGMAGAGRSPEEAAAGISFVVAKMQTAVATATTAANFRGSQILIEALKAINLVPDDLIGVWQSAKPEERVLRLLQLLKDAAGVAGKGDKLQSDTLLGAVFNVLAGQSYKDPMIHVAQNIEKVIGTLYRLKKAHGEVDRGSKIAMEGMKGKWDLLWSQYATLKEAVADAGVSSAFITMLDTANWSLSKVQERHPVTQELKYPWAMSGAAIGIVGSSLMLLGAILPKIAAWLFQGAKLWKEFPIHLQKVAAVASKAKPALRSFGHFLHKWHFPIHYAILFGGALLTKWQEISDWFSRASWSWDWLREGLSSTWDLIRADFNSYAQALAVGLWKFFWQPIEQMLRNISPALANRIFGVERGPAAVKRYSDLTNDLNEAEDQRMESLKRQAAQDEERLKIEEELKAAREALDAAQAKYSEAMQDGADPEKIVQLYQAMEELSRSYQSVAERAEIANKAISATVDELAWVDDRIADIEKKRSLALKPVLAGNEGTVGDIRAQFYGGYFAGGGGFGVPAYVQEALRPSFDEYQHLPYDVARVERYLPFIPDPPGAGGERNVEIKNEVHVEQRLPEGVSPEAVAQATGQVVSKELKKLSHTFVEGTISPEN